jgi:nitrite reductase (NADH) large subunit
MTKQNLVVVGNGMAGARLVEEVLAKGGGDQFDISIFGDEPHGNYNRILLSGVLSGTHSQENIFINPLEWYEKSNVTLYAGVRAIGVDRKAQTVYAAGGHLVPYDKLVIATGSVPFVPPMDGLYDEDGSFRQGLFVFRTLDDCVQMIEHAADARSAVVIGGGLLGLEAARGLLNRGLEVHVVHLAAYLMESQLDSLAGELLKGSLEDMGVTFHLEKTTQRCLVRSV